jgi:uncharacterized membrane protein
VDVVVGILVVAVIFGAPIVSLVLIARLNRRVDALDSEVHRLRGVTDVGPPVQPRTEPQSAPDPTPELVIEREPEPEPPPAAGREGRSLEAFVGGRVMLVVGVIAVLLSLAFFLKLAIDRGWIGPGGRIATGLVFGVVALFAGDRIAVRGLRVFGHALMGAGLGALFPCTYFSAVRYGFIARPTAFVLMGIVTALGVALAVWRKAPTLAWLGFLGGFLAPALLGERVDRLESLTGWLVVLDAGLLLVLLKRRWAGLDVLALVASALYFSNWMVEWRIDERTAAASWCLVGLLSALLAVSLVPAMFTRSMLSVTALSTAALAGFLAIAAGYDLLFPQDRYVFGVAIVAIGALQALAGAISAARRGARGPDTEALYGFALAAVAIAIPVLLEQRAVAPAWAAAGLAIVHAGIRLGREVFVQGGLAVIALSVGRLVVDDMPLHDAAFIPFFNVPFLCAISPCAALLLSARMLRRDTTMKLGRLPITLIYLGAWLFTLPLFADLHDHFMQGRDGYGVGYREYALLASAAGVSAYTLLLAALTRRDAGPLRALAAGPMVGAFFVAVAILSTPRRPEFTPAFNALFIGGLIVAVTCLVVGRLARGAGRVVALLAALVLFLAQITAEIDRWGDLAPLGEATRRQLQFRAQVGISAAWALYAATLVALGFRFGRTPLRWAGLGLFGLTVLKVFLGDMAELDTSYRVGSFLVLGVLLVGASYLYQRMRQPGS